MPVGAADNVSAAEWIPCPLLYQQAVTNAIGNLGWIGGSAVITQVEYWDRLGSDSLAKGEWTDQIPSPDPDPAKSSCQQADARNTPETTLQKVTIQVTSPSGKITRNIEVVKSIITDASGVPDVP